MAAITLEQASEVVITKVATAAQYGGAGTALTFGFTDNQWTAVGILGGLVIGALGLMVNVWFKSQHLRLARERAFAADGE